MENKDMQAVELNDEQIEEMKEELGKGVYTHDLSKPFQWEGKVYGQLVFDFDSLTGRDTLAIERELAAQNIFTVVRRLNIEFQVRVAARAGKYGVDMLEALPIRDFEAIMNHVSGFFARGE